MYQELIKGIYNGILWTITHKEGLVFIAVFILFGILNAINND